MRLVREEEWAGWCVALAVLDPLMHRTHKSFIIFEMMIISPEGSLPSSVSPEEVDVGKPRSHDVRRRERVGEFVGILGRLDDLGRVVLHDEAPDELAHGGRDRLADPRGRKLTD